MANSDEILQAYLNKMLTLQGEKRDKPFSEAELKQMALDMGMTEEDWLESRKAFEGHLKSGQGHLNYGNWQDALRELEQAIALNPNSSEAAYGLANAYKGQLIETQNPAFKQQAEKYAELALQLNPGNKATLQILRELREGEKHIAQTQKSRKFVLYGFLGVLVLIAIILYTSAYNAVVGKKETVAGKWAQVENVYQRRADLIPKLVETVKASAKFEKETLEKLIKARTGLGSLQIDGKNLSGDQIREFQEKQEQLTAALNRIMVVSENYPELRTTQAFRDLQIQIEGSENRITVERKRFNEAVQEYNAFIKRFPNSLLGFKEKVYFEVKKGVENAPEVKF